MGRLGVDPSLARGMTIQGARNIFVGARFATTGVCFLAARDGRIEIGDHVGLNTNVHINANDRGEIVIGTGVLFGPNCVIRASNHIYDDPQIPIRLQGHTGGRIVIEDDVWVGANVTVIGGVRVGAGAVLAAGAVVTQDVGPGDVVGGVPAKLIRRRGQPKLDVT